MYWPVTSCLASVKPMHELGIAQNIISIATDYARKAGSGEIQELVVEIGQLSGVVREALSFSLEVSRKDSILKNARIHYLEPRGMAFCLDCHKEFALEQLYDLCPHCGSKRKKVTGGRELKLSSIVVA